ncbi:Hsp20/alpha crystallin family protein [Kroppenstedtia eburnea]|jgi:HSP20 family protein|uniref:Heat shock protein Hsp20 n=2 Tax=Kroppenstedtia TaxID=1274351 RepID=A0A1N7LWG7_9BACL|nr:MULTISPECIES: Hsp20/alpha crystallin family protein [Kroppenstedtia]QKI81680.1 Hsp20/alpha crystallin family protein [Kroppenstedtia eburnea]GGA52716.1 type III effector protein [Kroppenstedtia guangzhouensis]SIS78166.1 heat shock protein Hsp20 [Kroppenstedtia eburnea]
MGFLERYEGHHDPVTRFRHELDRSFQRFFNEPLFPGEEFGRQRFLPALNVEEKADHYVIQAEMPGMEPDDIEIEVQGNTLVIRGERREERKEDSRYHLVESRYGTFQRSFPLPDNVDVEGITADAKNGVLFIRVPKDQSREPRRIQINRH